MKKNKSGASKGNAPAHGKKDRAAGGADARKFSSFEGLDVLSPVGNAVDGDGSQSAKEK